MNASRSRSPRTIEEEEGWKWAGVYRKSDLGAVSEVIYIRTITDEERDLSLSEGSTRADRQENLDTVRKLCAKNEEMWSQHKKFVLVETGSGDKFRRRVELAAVALSGLLKFKLQPGWDSILDQS